MAKANIHVLSEIIGEDAALKLAKALPSYNGRRCLYVPMRWKKAAWLVPIIGYDNAQNLHAEMAGCQIRIGSLAKYERRKAALKMLSAPEITVSKIACQTGVHRSTIYRNWRAVA